MYDPELILSWTPREYRNFIKGAQLRQMDRFEYMAKSAMANAYASNAKRAKERKIFDKQKAIRRLEKNMNWQDARQYDMSYIKKMKESLESWTPEFIPEGGRS